MNTFEKDKKDLEIQLNEKDEKKVNIFSVRNIFIVGGIIALVSLAVGLGYFYREKLFGTGTTSIPTTSSPKAKVTDKTFDLEFSTSGPKGSGESYHKKGYTSLEDLFESFANVPASLTLVSGIEEDWFKNKHTGKLSLPVKVNGKKELRSFDDFDQLLKAIRSLAKNKTGTVIDCEELKKVSI